MVKDSKEVQCLAHDACIVQGTVVPVNWVIAWLQDQGLVVVGKSLLSVWAAPSDIRSTTMSSGWKKLGKETENQKTRGDSISYQSRHWETAGNRLSGHIYIQTCNQKCPSHHKPIKEGEWRWSRQWSLLYLLAFCHLTYQC